MKKEKVELSVMKGDRLFNENTPFVINIFIQESKNMKKYSNADLICVIDISGSMAGTKIELVKKSLNILVDLMDKDDRICLILFNDSGKNYFDLNYLTSENKNNIHSIINEIQASGGTKIISGLEIAIDILINDKDKDKPNRASSILLLSDGCDNELNDLEIGQKLKDLTKGKNLNFTLNAFGYGNDHDPKIMKKLSSIRDGTFFYVEKYQKVAEYFGIVLGSCTSVISNRACLVLELLNKKCEIKKIFGEEYLYSYELKPTYFSTSMLQFISGKEFTYVLEFELKLNEVKKGEDLLLIDFFYQDHDNNFCKKRVIYKYCLNDVNCNKANKEYIRSQVYSIIGKSLKLKEQYQNNKAKQILEEMKKWLVKNNNKSQNNLFLNDVNKALNYYNNEKEFKSKGVSDIESNVMGNTKKNFYDVISPYTNSRQNYYSSNSHEMMIEPNKIRHLDTDKSLKKKNCSIF